MEGEEAEDKKKSVISGCGGSGRRGIERGRERRWFRGIYIGRCRESLDQ